MAEPVRTTVRQVIEALADLAPAAGQRSTTLVIPTEWFRWLPLAAVRLFLRSEPATRRGAKSRSTVAVRR